MNSQFYFKNANAMDAEEKKEGLFGMKQVDPIDTIRKALEHAAVGMGFAEELEEALTAIDFLAKQGWSPEGWKLVPVEPTGHMMQAAKFRHNSTETIDYRLTYIDMLSAAPEPPKE